MLKRLDRWLNSFTGFAYNHPAFVTVTSVILAAVAMIALCFTFAAVDGGVNPASQIRWEGDVTLDDTRTLHCIRFRDGGVSCDWTHVSGGDNL